MILAAIGAAFALAAYVIANPVVATLAWVVAVAVGSHGYGVAIERASRQRMPAVATIATGFAALLVGSLALAYLRVLSYPVQLGLIAAGIAACALPRRERPIRPPMHPGALLYAAALGGLFIGMAAILGEVSTDDDMNHAFVVKRLWDLGAIGLVHHQAGLQFIGESFLSLVVDASAVRIFEAGACCTLAIFLFGEQLAAHDDELAMPLFVAVATPLAIGFGGTIQWPAVALILGAFGALDRAIASRRTGWHTIILGVALGALRHEYLLIALPLVAAAIVLPRPAPSRRALVLLGAAWCVVLLALQIALAVPPVVAARNTVALMAVGPLVYLALQLFGTYGFRSALAVVAFGAASTRLAVRLDAFRGEQHGPTATFVVWVALMLCSLSLVDRRALTRGPGPRVNAGAIAVICTFFLIHVITAPNFNYQLRDRIVARYADALLAFKQYRALGGDVRTVDDELHTLQMHVPAGARIAFWGRNPEQLDFARNPITDISIPKATRRNRTFLMRIVAASLKGQAYLLVENLDPTPKLDPTVTDPWAAPSSATAMVDGMLETLWVTESARLCRVH